MGDLFDDEGVYRIVALFCAAVLTGECKDKTREGLASASQQTLSIADNYLEWADRLSDVPRADLTGAIEKAGKSK